MTVRVGLVSKAGVPGARELAGRVSVWARKQGYDLLVEQGSLSDLDHYVMALGREELAVKADPIISLGGDGTLIGVARHVNGHSPLLIGVNFGCLGFLTEVVPQDLFNVLEDVLAGRADVAVRSMLTVEVSRCGQIIFKSQAINEVVVLKGASDRLLTLDISVDGEDVTRIKADGVIVATPTGSTAYSLSAGGSITAPWLPVILITPICAHSLTNRPLIIGDSSMVEVVVPSYEGQVFVNVDGQVSHDLEIGDVVRVRRSLNSVKFVRSSSQSYFRILRTKLNWGLTNHGCD